MCDEGARAQAERGGDGWGVGDEESEVQGIALLGMQGDGLGLGDASREGVGLGNVEARGCRWPGKHTTSIEVGQPSPAQFQSPYRVLPAQEPSPVHDKLQRLGVDVRMQNILVLVQELIPEQSTVTPSRTMIESSPDVAEQLAGSAHLSDKVESG